MRRSPPPSSELTVTPPKRLTFRRRCKTSSLISGPTPPAHLPLLTPLQPNPYKAKSSEGLSMQRREQRIDVWDTGGDKEPGQPIMSPELTRMPKIPWTRPATIGPLRTPTPAQQAAILPVSKTAKHPRITRHPRPTPLYGPNRSLQSTLHFGKDARQAV